MEVVETRYPFDNFVEFFSGGYGFGVAGFHLTIAFAVVIIGAIITVRQPRQTIVSALSMLYFSLQPFNNPAFTLSGVTIADLCGICVAVASVGRYFIAEIKFNRFTLAFVAFTAFSALHGGIVWTLDRAFVEQADIISRYVIVARTVIFPLVFAWIYTSQDPVWYFTTLLRVISLFTIAICLIYLIQLAIFFSGTLPYGTFSGAGISTTVAFGGVSIERGHLSRFMAPLIVPLFINCFIVRRYWPLALYSLIMVINFSASGLSFVAAQLLIATVLFWSRLRIVLLSWRGIVVSAAGTALIIAFSGAYGTIIGKIYRLAILGDESDGGGRSINLMLRYLDTYPFGTGYSGSTFRTAPGMAEINMGLYAFVTQMSVFSLLFIWLLVANVVMLYYRFRKGHDVAKMLLVGALVIPFVFSTDILWFGPLWWLPVFFLVSYRRMFQETPDAAWRNDEGRRVLRANLGTARASPLPSVPS